MILTFYKNLSDPKKVIKNITSLGAIQNCVLRDEQNILDPVFEVASAALPDDFNYVYCDYTGRYYFTGNAIMVRTGLWRIPCHVDVLSSHYEKYKTVSATITRNETVRNGYLIDGNYKTYAYKECVTRKFPVAFDTDSLILITVG